MIKQGLLEFEEQEGDKVDQLNSPLAMREKQNDRKTCILLLSLCRSCDALIDYSVSELKLLFQGLSSLIKKKISDGKCHQSRSTMLCVFMCISDRSIDTLLISMLVLFL